MIDSMWCVAQPPDLSEPGQCVYQSLDRMACDQDRHGLLNILCKMCCRHRMIPKSMLVGEHLNGELIEEYDGGQATVFRGKYKDRPVAVKTVHIYVTSDLGKCFSVRIPAPCVSEVPIDHGLHRNSVERLLRGDTSDTRTSYRFSVWIWIWTSPGSR